MRQAEFIVTQDLIWSSRVENGQGGHFGANRVNLLPIDRPLNGANLVFQGVDDGVGERYAHLLGELPREPVRDGILNVKSAALLHTFIVS